MKARLGRTIPHFEQVDLSDTRAVFSSDRIYRYRLSMRYLNSMFDKGRANQLAVILKNPSAADAGLADATIRKVETFVYHRFPDVRVIHILNIFAYRATDPGDLNRVFAREGAVAVIGEENDRVIAETVEQCQYIIPAWGNRSGIHETLYRERIYRVKMLLAVVSQHKLFVVRGRTQTKEPLHGLMWGYRYDVEPAPIQLLEV